jgi:ParB family transcriptional regulator, chromosome partitioning protein
LTEEDIAARHFVTPAIVKQRLRLASVSPKLRDVYAEDGMALEQSCALRWARCLRTGGWRRLADLFEHDDGGWLQDVSLLDRLVTEKLKAEAETIATGGWKWISVADDFAHGHSDGLRELEGKPADLTGDEQATIDAPNAEHAKLEFDHQDADELPDEVDQRLGEIEAALVCHSKRVCGL